jgi:FeS assembly protein IscX
LTRDAAVLYWTGLADEHPQAVVERRADEGWPSRQTEKQMSLDWESAYAVALELRTRHPAAQLQDVTLGEIFHWTLELPEFADDPAMCNDEILQSIYQEWYEVSLND